MKQFYLFVIFSILFAGTIKSQSNKAAEGPFSQLIIRGVTLINGNGAPPIGP